MKTKTKKAISLIVLVITIIVLAILAATVVITITNSGLINSAKYSQDSYNVAQEKAQIDVVLKDWAVTKVTQTEVTFIDFMKTNFGADRVSDNEDGTINITMQSGNIYKVKADGTITLLKGIILAATGMPLELRDGVGSTGTLTATLAQVTGDITWTNDNDAVATLSNTTGESITVTAVAEGQTKVTASCGGYTAEYLVQVIEKGIIITPTGMPMTLTEGTTVTGTLSAELLKISGEVTWANENDSVATISATTGDSITVTAVAKGQTKITASCSGYTAEYTVVVKQPATLNVGQYVIYDVTYTDVYQGTVYNNTTTGQYGWRYLGKEAGTGKHLLISTGIPMILYHYYDGGTVGASKWWDADTTLNANVRVTNGMLNNFNKIPYTQQATGASMSSSQYNTAIGRFAAPSITNNGETYNAVGDYFKVAGKTYTDEIIVRTLTLAELNRAVNSANAGVEGYTDRLDTDTAEGFKDLTGDALGLFDMQDLTGYTAIYYYWLASPNASSVRHVHYVDSRNVYASSNGSTRYGLRPVVSLPSDIGFEDENEDGIWEIPD